MCLSLTYINSKSKPNTPHGDIHFDTKLKMIRSV